MTALAVPLAVQDQVPLDYGCCCNTYIIGYFSIYHNVEIDTCLTFSKFSFGVFRRGSFY